MMATTWSMAYGRDVLPPDKMLWAHRKKFFSTTSPFHAWVFVLLSVYLSNNSFIIIISSLRCCPLVIDLMNMCEWFLRLFLSFVSSIDTMLSIRHPYFVGFLLAIATYEKHAIHPQRCHTNSQLTLGAILRSAHYLNVEEYAMSFLSATPAVATRSSILTEPHFWLQCIDALDRRLAYFEVVLNESAYL